MTTVLTFNAAQLRRPGLDLMMGACSTSHSKAMWVISLTNVIDSYAALATARLPTPERG